MEVIGVGVEVIELAGGVEVVVLIGGLEVVVVVEEEGVEIVCDSCNSCSSHMSNDRSGSSSSNYSCRSRSWSCCSVVVEQ